MYKKILLLTVLLTFVFCSVVFADNLKINGLKFGYAEKKGDVKTITKEATTIKPVNNYECTVDGKKVKGTMIGISFNYEGSTDNVILRLKMPAAGKFYNKEGKEVAKNVSEYDFPVKLEKGTFIKTFALLPEDPFGKYTIEIIQNKKVISSVEFNYKKCTNCDNCDKCNK